MTGLQTNSNTNFSLLAAGPGPWARLWPGTPVASTRMPAVAKRAGRCSHRACYGACSCPAASHGAPQSLAPAPTSVSTEPPLPGGTLWSSSKSKPLLSDQSQPRTSRTAIPAARAALAKQCTAGSKQTQTARTLPLRRQPATPPTGSGILPSFSPRTITWQSKIHNPGSAASQPSPHPAPRTSSCIAFSPRTVTWQEIFSLRRMAHWRTV